MEGLVVFIYESLLNKENIIMSHKGMGSYDEIPEGMKYYLNNYGYHFNKKMCDWAVSQMYKKVDGIKQYINPYTKGQVDTLLKQYNVNLERNKMYDAVYVANMCAADFLGKSVPNEQHLAKYIKDVIDDPDAEDGFIFNRFIADCYFMDNPIEWEDIIE